MSNYVVVIFGCTYKYITCCKRILILAFQASKVLFTVFKCALWNFARTL